MAYNLDLEFHLPVAPEKVMRLLTEPALMKAWTGGDAVFENHVGGKFEMFDGWAKGKVLKTGENELAYTWTAGDWEENMQPSKVHYILVNENGATKVELKHTDFPNEVEMNKHESGWTEHFFVPMENYILKNDF